MTDKKMSTLDQWEAEAKDNINNGNDFPDTIHFKSFIRRLKYREDRILALIDLVRKKDETLKVMIENSDSRSHWGEFIREVLALTEQLK